MIMTIVLAAALAYPTTKKGQMVDDYFGTKVVDKYRYFENMKDPAVQAYFKAENSWTFNHVNGKDKETVSFQPQLSMNDFTGVASALVAGSSIGDLPPVVQPGLVRDGRLVEVLPDWRFRSFDLLMVHLSNRHIARTVRVFKEFAVQMIPTLFPDLPT